MSAEVQVSQASEGDAEAPTSSTTPEKEEEVKLNRKNLEQLVRDMVVKWTDNLNLRDWDITVYILEEELPDSCDKENAAACVYHDFGHHIAEVYLLHPDKWSDIKGGFWNDKDESFIETILVHELLHIHFSHHHPIKNSWALEREELAINQLTKAFIRLDNQIKEKG